MRARIPIAASLALALTACGGPKADDGTRSGIQVQLVDAATGLAHQVADLSKALSPAGDFAAFAATPPTATADINCFMINVTGAGVAGTPLFAQECSSATNMQGRGVGAVSSPRARGMPISVSVAAGPARTIDVYGIYPSVQECGAAGSQESAGYFVGRTTIDVNDDATVQIPVSFIAGSPADVTCQHAGGGSTFAQFGTGVDGDASLAGATVDLSTHALPNSRTAMAIRRVTSIDTAQGTLLTVNAPFTDDNHYKVGDEVLIATMASAAGACTSSGNALDPGFMAFNTVAAINGAGSSITLSTPLVADPSLILNGNIGAAPGGGAFCAIQIIRVPHFNNLDIGGASPTDVIAPVYVNGTGIGGIVAFRVNGSISTSGSGTKRIAMGVSGFPGAPASGTFANGSQGSGTGGAGIIINTANGTGGGGGMAASPNGAGGGGGAQSQAGGTGGGGTPAPGSAGIGLGCAPDGCMVLGGGGGAGGGANTQTGGSGGVGGGNIFIAARNINTTVLPLILAADGGAGTAGSDPTGGGGGGGAGGSILLRYQSQTSGNAISTSSLGGTGASSGGAGGGGGGGAGGRIRIEYCNTTIPPSTAANGGNGGTGALGAGSNGGNGTVEVNGSAANPFCGI